ENLALERGSESRLLQHLSRQQSKENAHALLIELGFWEESYNPYPQRLELIDDKLPETPESIVIECKSLDKTDKERLDLTHLKAFAIDDEESNDPDDAISFDGERLWVHVADVASLIDIDSPTDLLARTKARTLYLPEGIQTMLPELLTNELAIGLKENSNALSFAISIDEKSTITDLEIIPSRIKVTRLSYKEAEDLIAKDEQLIRINAITKAHRQKRLHRDAVEIDMPESKVKVTDNRVTITALLKLSSRELVSEAMLMAGSACAEYAEKHSLPMPYAGQVPPNNEMPYTDDLAPLVAMFAKRRMMRPGRISCTPQSHFGLGLAAYIRVTSPLRRYLDLVAHQQLRLHLKGATPFTENEITARIGAVNATSNRIRQAERLSNRHWTLVYLHQHPDWQGEAVVVAEWGRKSLLIIPELALEFEQTIPGTPLPGSHLILSSPRVNLPY
ncbi:MAG: RNB domain-containing ribonuclease, partial [Deltaproteobacteria bacterium]|nr:RNB domain-containing ribonuclease [Deltaproteobacteria bacterium]